MIAIITVLFVISETLLIALGNYRMALIAFTWFILGMVMGSLLEFHSHHGGKNK